MWGGNLSRPQLVWLSSLCLPHLPHRQEQVLHTQMPEDSPALGVGSVQLDRSPTIEEEQIHGWAIVQLRWVRLAFSSMVCYFPCCWEKLSCWDGSYLMIYRKNENELQFPTSRSVASDTMRSELMSAFLTSDEGAHLPPWQQCSEPRI